MIAITGASGSIYAKILLQKLVAAKNQWSDLAIVITENAKEVWKTESKEETNSKNEPWLEFQAKFYPTNDFSAPFASGSGQFDTMIIIPCSMGVLGRIASGISNDLITRAADVILKEKRKATLHRCTRV